MSPDLLERLLSILFASRLHKRERLAAIHREGATAALHAYAAANDLSATLYATAIDASDPFADEFRPPHDDGKVIGYTNANASLLSSEAESIISKAIANGVTVCVVKGGAVARLYSPSILRHQNDIDLAVPDFGQFIALEQLLHDRGYLPQVLAVRFDNSGELLGTISMVRIDVEARNTYWLDVWIGAQPIALNRSLSLPSELWQHNTSKYARIGITAPEFALRILLGEIVERGEIRLRDVLDYTAIRFNIGTQSMSGLNAFNRLDNFLHWFLINNLHHFNIGWPGINRIVLQRATSSSTPVSVETAPFPVRHPYCFEDIAYYTHSPFMRLQPHPGESGSLAYSVENGRVLLRTPFGQFTSIGMLADVGS